MDNNTKFYNALSWGIQDNDVGNIRKNGMLYLQQLNLITPDYQSISIEEFCYNLDSLLNKINNSGYRIIFESPSSELPRYVWTEVEGFLVNNEPIGIRDIKEFITLKRELLIDYNISLMEIVEEIENSFCGTAIADEYGNVIIEILKGKVNSRYLTSTGVDPENIEHYDFNGININLEIPRFITEIRKNCEFIPGYYEFAYGKINELKDVYYTFYSDNAKYRNIFDHSIYIQPDFLQRNYISDEEKNKSLTLGKW